MPTAQSNTAHPRLRPPRLPATHQGVLCCRATQEPRALARCRPHAVPRALPCTHFSFSTPTRVSFVWRGPGLPPCTHFSSGFLARALSAESPEPPRPAPAAPYIPPAMPQPEVPRGPPSSRAKAPARLSYQAHAVYTGHQDTEDHSCACRTGCWKYRRSSKIRKEQNVANERIRQNQRKRIDGDKPSN